MTTLFPLPYFVALPLLVGFVLPVLKERRERVADWIVCLATVVLMMMSISYVSTPGTVYWMGGWKPLQVLGVQKTIGIAMYCDALSALMLMLINFISFIVAVFATEYMGRYTSKPKFYCLFMLMLAGMNGVVLTGDLFNLFVFLEIASIASYALVGFGCEHEELEASFKYLVLGSVTSSFILFAIAIVYGATGTLNMAQAANVMRGNGSKALLLALAMFLMGFGLKGAMVPFHAWLPDAHPSAPAPISAMLSGLLIKALGIYALARITFCVFEMTSLVGTILMAMGMLSMVVGVLLAVGQSDFKRLLAYHSISQMGYVVLALGIGGSVLASGGSLAVANLAIIGALFHLVNHGVFKSLLFLCSGAVEYSTGTRQLTELGGLNKRMPVTSAACRIAALSISGVPPFNGFWSKLFIIVATALAGYYWVTAITVIVSFLTLISFIKVQKYALGGDLPERLNDVREVPVAMTAPLVVLAALCVVMGVMLTVPVMRVLILSPAGMVLFDGVHYAQQVLGL